MDQIFDKRTAGFPRFSLIFCAIIAFLYKKRPSLCESPYIASSRSAYRPTDHRKNAQMCDFFIFLKNPRTECGNNIR